jgi:RNA polymerase sigma factor (sigma-70 family)
LRSPSDQELMQRIRAGDLDAVGTLFSRYHSWVYAMCCRLAGDAAAAEDLTQDCFLRVLRYGRSFDGRAQFTTWLYRLVRNRCLDHVATRRREQAGLALLADTPPGGTPAQGLDERGAMLEAALARLSPEKREVLVLSRFHNLTYAEIAEVCGITVANVKVRAHRAMRELKNILRQMETPS